MKITVHLVVCDDDGHEETVTEVVILEKACQRIEQVGLTLAEAKAVLTGLQQRIVERQIASFLATRRHCQVCGQALRTKGHHSLTFRTLFGTITLNSVRLRQCECTPDETATFSPLTEFLSEHTAPELLFMETKWASLANLAKTSWVFVTCGDKGTGPGLLVPGDRLAVTTRPPLATGAVHRVRVKVLRGKRRQVVEV